MLLKKDQNSKRRSSGVHPEEWLDQKKDIEELLEKYRGLNAEDLEPMNPYYSCVVCSKYKTTCGDGEIGCSCPDAEPASEDQFSLNYDF